jgi:hypothetical protein
MIEGSRLRSLKELTESPALVPSTQQTPQQAVAPAPSILDQKVTATALLQPPQRNMAAANSSNRPANTTQETQQPGSTAVASTLSTSGQKLQQQALSSSPSTQSKSASPGTLRVQATGQHAAEMSGVYQKTGERVNGYPLYKKKDDP